jgi:hypothetical protein
LESEKASRKAAGKGRAAREQKGDDDEDNAAPEREVEAKEGQSGSEDSDADAENSDGEPAATTVTADGLEVKKKKKAIVPVLRTKDEGLNPDFEGGIARARKFVQKSCIWDQPIRFGDQVKDHSLSRQGLQLEIMETLHRLVEHFGAAAFSISQVGQSRSSR